MKLARVEGQAFTAIKFIITGAINVASGYLIFTILILLGLHYWVAYVCTIVAWNFVGHRIQKKWVFPDSVNEKTFLRYSLIQVVVVLISGALLTLSVEIVGINPILSYPLIYLFLAILLFISYRIWVFPPKIPDSKKA